MTLVDYQTHVIEDFYCETEPNKFDEDNPAIMIEKENTNTMQMPTEPYEY